MARRLAQNIIFRASRRTRRAPLRLEDDVAAELQRLRAERREPYIGFSIDVYMAQGLAFLEAKEYENAEHSFHAAHVLSLDAIEPQLFRARAYHLAGARERAESILQQWFVDSPDAEKAQTALWTVTTYSSLPDYERARKWIAQIGNERLVARLNIYFLFRLGRTDDAIDFGRKLVAGESRDPIAYYLLGLVLFDDLMFQLESQQLERLSEVIQVLERALELKKDYPSGRKLLALAEGERKRIMEGPKTTRIALFTLLAALGGSAQAQEGFFDPARRLEALNADDATPVISPDGRELFFVRKPGGKGGLDIWVTTRDTGDDTFGEPRNLGELNTRFNEGASGISSNGLTLYFDSDRPEGRGWDIWVAKRDSLDQPFEVQRNLEELNTDALEGFSNVTEDDLEIYFTREGPTTRRGDLFVARRAHPDERFGDPSPLVELNRGNMESSPYISPDGLSLFFSAYDWGGGFGDHDIWVATRPSRTNHAGPVPFGTPVHLGSAVNTGFVEWQPAISFDWPASGAKLYFSRWMRPGNEYIYEATWHLDCNRNGVDDLEDIESGDADDRDANDIPDECEPEPPVTFRRGDSNDDGKVNIADGVSILGLLFVGNRQLLCHDAADIDDSGQLNVADAIATFNWLFLEGAPPAPPGSEECGVDTTADELGCEAYTNC